MKKYRDNIAGNRIEAFIHVPEYRARRSGSNPQAPLSELTVLAAAAVESALALQLIFFLLAGDAEAHTGDRLAPGCGDIDAAFFAVSEALTSG